MKYQITLKGKTYEILVERGEAMVLDEYDAKAPVPTASRVALSVSRCSRFSVMSEIKTT